MTLEGGEIAESIWRKHGETFPSVENLETIVSGHGEEQASMEKHGDYHETILNRIRITG
jgi:hypothetical protein